MRRRFLPRLLLALTALAGLAGISWSTLALWFDGPHDPLWAAMTSGLVVIGAALAIAMVRPFPRAVFSLFAGTAVVVTWWLSIPPRNDRQWYADVAELPWGTVEGDHLTLHNVRNFTYRTDTDYTPRWETRTYDLAQLTGIDLFISYWGPTLIAHTIASWEFADGQHLAISIETRKEQGESYSAVRGFFRQYELYYVVADERDVVGVRTNVRGERVYLYRFRAAPERARAILLDYVAEINALRERPVWYNALTQNCTTTIRHHLKHVSPESTWDWRILANGRLDELAYERGNINTTLPFATLRQHSDITAAAQRAATDADFSARIRSDLPPRPQ